MQPAMTWLDALSRPPPRSHMLIGKHPVRSAPMYVVHYVASRDSDQLIDKGVSAADTLPDAIVRVKGAAQDCQRRSVKASPDRLPDIRRHRADAVASRISGLTPIP